MFGYLAVSLSSNFFNKILDGKNMPEEWRKRTLIPISENNSDVHNCSNYRGINLMRHTIKIWERAIERRLREEVKICDQQYGFMPGKSTTDALFALRILMKEYRRSCIAHLWTWKRRMTLC